MEMTYKKERSDQERKITLLEKDFASIQNKITEKDEQVCTVIAALNSTNSTKKSEFLKKINLVSTENYRLFIFFNKALFTYFLFLPRRLSSIIGNLRQSPKFSSCLICQNKAHEISVGWISKSTKISSKSFFLSQEIILIKIFKW